MKRTRVLIGCLLLLAVLIPAAGSLANLEDCSGLICTTGTGEGETVGIPSPLTEVASVDELNAAVGCCLFPVDPEYNPVSGERFTVISGSPAIAEYCFHWEETEVTLRAAVSSGDISGVYMDDGTMPLDHLTEEDPYAFIDTGYGIWTRWFLGGMQYSLLVAPGGETDAEETGRTIRDIEALLQPWNVAEEPAEEEEEQESAGVFYRETLKNWNAEMETAFGTGTQAPFSSIGILAEDDSMLQSPDDVRQIVTVSTVDELIRAIAPDTVVRLNPGIYDLSEAEGYGSERGMYYHWEEVYDGYELYLDGVDNLTLIGTLSGSADAPVLESHIRTASAMANVLNVRSSDKVTLVGLKIGHVETEGCAGGVLNLISCDEVTVGGCELYGCGSIGILAKKCDNIRTVDTLIHSCSAGLMELTDCEGAIFSECSFLNTEGYSGVFLDCCKDIFFTGSDFAFNRLIELFYCSESDTVTVSGCLIAYNDTGMELTGGTWDTEEDPVTFVNCAYVDYVMDYGSYEPLPAG